MDVLSNLSVWGGGWTGWILPFLFGLGVVVFFHELGHFLVARWVGVKVLTFSVGFGPEIFGFDDRYETRWKISAIPLGGYVKFLGDENAASVPDREAAAAMTEDERAQSFVHKSLPRRTAVVAAGPIANFILACLIFSGIFMFYGKSATMARVDTVADGSAAERAGFKSGDLVRSINGRAIDSFSDMQRLVARNAGETLQVTVDRDGKNVVLTAVPELKDIEDNFGNVHQIGVLGITRAVSADDATTEKVAPLAAIGLGVQRTWDVIDGTLTYLSRVITGRESAKQIGGVIGIAQVSGQVATLGFMPILDLAGVLSVSIGLLNLFPIPLLDGGHLLFYAIEALRGRPLSERAQEVGFRFGLAIVLMLMIFATYNDISRVSWLKWLWS